MVKLRRNEVNKFFFIFSIIFYLVSTQFYQILLTFTSSGTKSYQIPLVHNACSATLCNSGRVLHQTGAVGNIMDHMGPMYSRPLCSGFRCETVVCGWKKGTSSGETHRECRNHQLPSVSSLPSLDFWASNDTGTMKCSEASRGLHAFVNDNTGAPANPSPVALHGKGTV